MQKRLLTSNTAPKGKDVKEESKKKDSAKKDPLVAKKY